MDNKQDFERIEKRAKARKTVSRVITYVLLNVVI